MKNYIVAIDGPAGSGKSSISKIVAEKCGFTHVDTGAMFRAITLYAMNNNIKLDDENAYSFLDNLKLVFKNDKTILNGEDVSEQIRTDVITNNVSTVAKIAKVREQMVEYERESAKEGLILMDGRDIGTVVLPHADLKIFLNASKEERAKRRLKENLERGLECTYEQVLEDIIARDYKDSHRAIAPLRKADDAIEIDTTNLTIEEVVSILIDLIEKGMKEKMENINMEDIVIKRYHIGEKVKGLVVQVEDKTLTLDLGTNLEGVMHLNHFTKDKNILSFVGLVKKGDEIEGEVSKITDEHIFLSRLNLLKDESFKDIILAKEEDKVITAKVVKEVEGKGYLLNYLGFELFMPKSQSAKNVVLKSNIDVKIIDVDENKKRAVVSSRVVEKEKEDLAKQKEYDAINVGDVLHGTVSKVLNYQVFVKVGNLQGIIKAKDVAHEFVNVLDVLHEGDELDVAVISKENGKLAFSRKALIKSPFEQFIGEHKVGDKVVGKVANKLPYGLLLELAPNLKGLLHSSEYSHNPNDNFNNCVIVGDEVEAAIINIDAKNERISLSRKALMDNPWERVTAQLGDLVDFKVEDVLANGLKVSAIGVDGFIPLSEAMEDRSKDLATYFNKGDEGKAYIIDINKKEWKLVLSIMRFQREEERKNYEKYLENEDVSTNIGEQFKDILKK